MSDVELLLDRFLSASTATDCLESLDNLLQGQFRLRRIPATKAVSGGVDPKSKRPSQEVENLEEERRQAEADEEERQLIAIDTLLHNVSALRALCCLVASSKLPPSRSDTSNNKSSSYANGGMEVEGGDVVACELLSMLLPKAATGPTNNAGAANVAGGATTEALQKQQRHRRRVEYIAKTMLTFHNTFDNGDSVADSVPALTPALLDCLCASSSLLSSNNDVPTSSSIAVPPPSVYARVLTLQILQSLLLASPGTLREQLMMAPDGINRLVDLLGHGTSTMGGDENVGDEEDRNSVPEEVRNESILFLTSLASSSSMLARLITFSEGYERVLKIALESSSSSTSSSSTSGGSSSGLSSGTTVPLDCLDLCLALAHGDEVARELFMGGGDGRGNLDRLAQLMDLRGAERYCNAERNAWWAKELKEKRYKEMNTEGAVKVVVGGKGEPVLTDVSTVRKGGKRGKKAKDDDLDDILSGASLSSSSSSSTPDVKKYHAVVQTATESEQKKALAREPDCPPTPYLTTNESNIVDSVFNLILVLLRDGDENTLSTKSNRSKRRGRAKSIMSHNLVRYIVDCALYTLPPPGVDYVSGVPSPALQQKALVTMGVLGSLGDTVISEEESTKTSNKESDKVRAATAIALRKKEMNDEYEIQTKLLFETMPIYLQGDVPAIDRLMYLCCTGAYSPMIPTDDNVYDYDERPEVIASLLSAYSISTFRSCLSSETASRMVLHALAPPPPDEDEMGLPLEPAVVTRLVTTLADNLRFLQSLQQHDGKSEGAVLDMNEVFRATIGASGSAGALGVFLTNGEGDATREMLLRLSPPPSSIEVELEQSSTNMIDFLLQHVATYDTGSTSNNSLHASSAYITVVLLKLLSEWVFGMPRAVMALLSSPSSVSLGVLLRSNKVGESNSEAVSALCGLLLGLCLEFMTDTDGASGSSISNDISEFDNSAWNRETIMKMIQSMGVGKYLSMIDEWKKRPLPLPYCNGEARSIIERRAFSSWYGHNVTLIRRRVVMALAGNRGDDSDESDVEGPDGPNKSSSSARSLRKMVSNQAQEIESLQTKLEDASLTITSQSIQIKELKRVTELGNSAETIDMMTEYTEKMAELEQMKKELRNDAEKQTKLRIQTIAAKDNEIAVLQKELSESQTCVEEIKRDNDTLREEMSGLSSAYNSLELQYHRTNSGDSTFAPTEQTAGGEAASEHGVTSNSSAGENAEPFASKYFGEVQFLREENARLREEGRAANEWMSMAVSKMEEMSGDNEALVRSLDEATSNLASTGSDTDSQSIQNQMDLLRVREEAETKLKAKDHEIANQQALVQQLEDRILQMNQENDESSSPHLEELQQVIARQEGELESLRQASREAQEWMATAVTHVETLTKEVQDKEELLKLQEKSDSNELEVKLAELENSLEGVTFELNESQKTQEAFSMEISELKAENENLLVKIGDMHLHDASEMEALTSELNQAKQDKVTLEYLTNQLQSRSETAQRQLVEVESKLNEVSSERDNLVNRLDSLVALAGDQSKFDEYNQLLEALKVELFEKNEQLERMQNQLIDDADDHEARVEKLLQDIETEKQRAEVLSQDASKMEALTAELDQMKQDKVTLEELTNQLQSRSETAQSQLVEIETKLNEITIERDNLVIRLDSLVALAGDQSKFNHHNEEIKALQDELFEKNEQLERMQNQLIDDADDHEARVDKLLQDIETEKQRAEVLSQDASKMEALTAELDQMKKDKVTLEELTNQLQSRSETAQSQLVEVETKLNEITIERDNLVNRLESFATLAGDQSKFNQHNEEIKALQDELFEKNQELERMQNQLLEDADDHEARIDKVLQDIEAEKERAEVLSQENTNLSAMIEELSLGKENLSSTLSEQLRSAQDQLAESEAKVDDLTCERDDLITRLGSNSSVDNESINLITSLRQELDVKNEQLSRIQDQLIEGAEESEVKLNQLVHDLDAEKQRAEGLCQDKVGLSSMIEKLSLETERKQALLDTINAGKNDADMRAEESQRRVSELEEVVQTAQLQNFVVLEQIKTITAERDEIKSQLTLLIEEYEKASMSHQDNQSLQNQISELMEKITQQDSEKDTLQNALDEVMEAAQQWQQRTQALESTVTSLEYQLEQQENEAAEAIALWENRCMTLEETGVDVIRQWEEKVQILESDVSILEIKLTQQEMEAIDVIAQWEARFSALGENEGEVVRQCEEKVRSLEVQLQTKEQEASESHSKFSQAEQSLTAAKDEINVSSKQITTLESSVAMMTSQIDILNKQIDEKSKAIENMQLYIDDKDVELADLATELQETQHHFERIVKQWQERSEQLEAQVTELENTIKETKTRSEENVRLWQERAESQEKEAADAIAQWDARCATLNERIVTLELELAAADADTSVATLKAEMGENETRLAATVEELEVKCSDYQKRIDDYVADIDRVKSMCSVLQEERNTAAKEKEESEIIALQLKDELRHTNEQLQSYATDQFTKKATDMATQALREQMQEIRARYSADQDALRSEIEARLSAEEEVERLKSDLALLAQATEFDDDVDVHVRKMAKKMTAENVKAERKEMAQLRSTLERLREELGSCRWNERQSEDNVTNARLHTSILEQEVSAAKKDLQLMEQALEELETSKVDMIVSFEYRIEVLENERLWIERSHEEELLGIKKELAESNEERDSLAYKLEQCEKNNTALVYSTAHNEPGGKESKSGLVKLQLERAQLLSKINEMGINLERRVREAVAAQVSLSEAELIVEKQSRHLVETSLSEAVTELDNVKKQLSVDVSKDGNGDDQLTQVLKEALDDLRKKNEKLLDKNKVLQVKVETIDKENKSTISDLRDKLQIVQEELRAHERESRFEAALAAEIDHLRSSSHTASISTHQALVLLDQNMQSRTWLDEGKESIDRNSAYVIEMYDYVCELKSSIVEERQMYKDLLAEHEDLLALLGQAGIEGIQ
jgi:chromosome segregation ATPase